MMEQVYVPPGIWRKIGLALLEANDLCALYNMCMACKDTHRALEPEFTDLFGKPLPHLDFRSQYIRERFCLPFVSKLKCLLSEMHTSQRNTSLLVFGGTGDIVQTVLRVIDEESRVTFPTQTVVMHWPFSALRKLTKTRRHASQNGQKMLPIMLVLLGLDAEAWRNTYVKSWVMNNRAYKASIMFVSQLRPSPMILANMDKIVRVNGIMFSEVSWM
jgi:hypothetical protein